MSKGWISLHRELQEHWLWKEKREFSKLEAWLDILLSVNHSEQKILIKNTLFVVSRGESIKSLDTWAYRWGWNKSKVRRFLNVLQNDSMIVTKNERKTTRLTVCKYDSYQDMRNADETIMKRKRNADETQTTPNNNVINNVSNNSSSSSSIKPPPTTSQDIIIVKHNEFLKECLTSHEWQSHVCRNTKIQMENIPMGLKKFNSHLIAEGEHKMNLGDYKKHFVSWTRIMKNKK